MRSRRGAPPRERRERVGAVRLRRPERVVAEPFRLDEQLGHTGGRTRTPVALHVSELQLLASPRPPPAPTPRTSPSTHHQHVKPRSSPSMRSSTASPSSTPPRNSISARATRGRPSAAKLLLDGRPVRGVVHVAAGRRDRSRARTTRTRRAVCGGFGCVSRAEHPPARRGLAPHRVELRGQRRGHAALPIDVRPYRRGPTRRATRPRARRCAVPPSADRCRCTTSRAPGRSRKRARVMQLASRDGGAPRCRRRSRRSTNRRPRRRAGSARARRGAAGASGRTSPSPTSRCDGHDAPGGRARPELVAGHAPTLP